ISAPPENSRNSGDTWPIRAARSASMTKLRPSRATLPPTSMRASWQRNSSAISILDGRHFHASQRFVARIDDERRHRPHEIEHLRRQPQRRIGTQALDAEQPAEQSRVRRWQLQDRRMIGQPRLLPRVLERLAQAAELVDQSPLERLLPRPHPTAADRVHLRLGQRPSERHPRQEDVVELADLLLQLLAFVRRERAEDRLGVGAWRGLVDLDVDADLVQELANVCLAVE